MDSKEARENSTIVNSDKSGQRNERSVKEASQIKMTDKIDFVPDRDLKTIDGCENIRILEPWPEGNLRLVETLLFEVVTEREKYQQMESEMQKFYSSRCNRAAYPHEKLKPGVHAVLYDKHKDVFLFKRVKVIGPAAVKNSKGHPTLYVVPVLPIDGGFEIHVFAEDLLYLHEQFASLPPRVLNFELDGMDYYKDSAAYKRASLIETGLWNGNLSTTLVDESARKVLMFSSVANKVDFPYGISEFIIRRMAAELQEPKLPEVGQERSGAFIVHSTFEGEIFIQFDTPFFQHYFYLMQQNKLKIKEKIGRIKSPVKVGTILLAPHYWSDGSYYRAICTNNISSDMIGVKFIDHGDCLSVKIADAVIASEIHKAFEVIPPLAASAFLFGIQYLDVNKFNSIVSAEQQLTVKVTNQLFEKTEVELIKCGVKDGTDTRQNVNAALKGENSFEPENITLPNFTNPLYVTHDILSSDGSGSECVYYRQGKELYLQIVEIEHDGKISVFPSVISDHIRKLEERLADSYRKRPITRKPFCEDRIKTYPYFMVDSNDLERVVRGMYIPNPKKSGNNMDESETEVFLIDYGLFETVKFSSLVMIHRSHCRLPCYGCRATLIDGNGEKMDADAVGIALKDGEVFLGKVVSAGIWNSIPEATIQFLGLNEGVNAKTLQTTVKKDDEVRMESNFQPEPNSFNS